MLGYYYFVSSSLLPINLLTSYLLTFYLLSDNRAGEDDLFDVGEANWCYVLGSILAQVDHAGGVWVKTCHTNIVVLPVCPQEHHRVLCPLEHVVLIVDIEIAKNIILIDVWTASLIWVVITARLHFGRDAQGNCLVIIIAIDYIIVGKADLILVVGALLAGGDSIVINVNTRCLILAGACSLCHIARVDVQVNWVLL